jgi:hypothetical protein
VRLIRGPLCDLHGAFRIDEVEQLRPQRSCNSTSGRHHLTRFPRERDAAVGERFASSHIGCDIVYFLPEPVHSRQVLQRLRHAAELRKVTARVGRQQRRERRQLAGAAARRSASGGRAGGCCGRTRAGLASSAANRVRRRSAATVTVVQDEQPSGRSSIV